MSDETHGQLDASISAHIADTFPGHYTSGWIVVVASSSIDNPNTTNYRLISADAQPLHVDDGLINIGRRIIGDTWDDSDEDEYDD